MKYFKYFSAFFLFITGTSCYAEVADTTVFYEYWNICSFANIGGHNVTKYGNPVIIDTDKGKAVKFDGNGDALIVDSNPIGSAKEFTVEVMFKPDAGVNITTMPRFLCFWDPNDANQTTTPRMTIELRVDNLNNWYFDGFLKTDKGSGLTLIDATKTHPTSEWMYAAVTYKDSMFTTYINGQMELSGKIGYTAKVLNPTGKTSVGARFNLVNWYSGIIKAIKVTHKALNPTEFFSIPDTIVTQEKKITTNRNKPEIYPIPAKKELFINDMQGKDLPVSISITSIAGKQVYRSNLLSNNKKTIKSLDISEIQNGIYFVGLQYADYYITRKICILH